MARLPDRFDLWVRKAQEATDPARKVDLVLGALVAKEQVYFLNGGSTEQPRIAQVDVLPGGCAIVFTDAGRVDDFFGLHPQGVIRPKSELSFITSPTAAALDWCVENKVGLLINPESNLPTAVISALAVASFVEEWKERGGRQAAGFWIPNMTTAEEDFWQENGL